MATIARTKSPQSHILLVDPFDQLVTAFGDTFTAGGHRVDVAKAYRDAVSQTRKNSFDAIVLPAPSGKGNNSADNVAEDYGRLIKAIEKQGAAALVIGDPPATAGADFLRMADFADATAGIDEIKGRLAAILRYHRMVRGMNRELVNMQKLFKHLNVQFNEVDQEMRLAGRLQSDFLPEREIDFGPVRFSALYRPASFVSGDFYDVRRVDEDHVAFYVADAVGHGMAASLLTMFIKNAVVSKVIEGNEYRLLAPGETLELLNDKLVAQHLPNSQFVTALYGLVNMRTLEVQFARAGHPYPLIFDGDGTSAELKNPGGLLGLFESERFITNRVNLKPGHKFVVYSDGVELSFAETAERDDATQHYREVFSENARLSSGDMAYGIGAAIDAESGSLNPKDDVTVLVLEVATESMKEQANAQSENAISIDRLAPLTG